MSRAALLAIVLLAAPVHAQTFAVGDIVPTLTALTAPALDHFEYFGEGHPNTTIVIAPATDLSLSVSIAETGFLDDSVAGQRTVYVIASAEGGWRVLDMTIEYRCHRSETRDWQSALCP